MASILLQNPRPDLWEWKCDKPIEIEIREDRLTAWKTVVIFENKTVKRKYMFSREEIENMPRGEEPMRIQKRILRVEVARIESERANNGKRVLCREF